MRYARDNSQGGCSENTAGDVSAQAKIDLCALRAGGPVVSGLTGLKDAHPRPGNEAGTVPVTVTSIAQSSLAWRLAACRPSTGAAGPR